MYNTAMMLSGLALQHVRAHTQFFLRFDNPLTIIVGPNTSGKTTLVEAVHLLSTGASFRATKIDEMIQFGAELARIKGVVSGTVSNLTTDHEAELDQGNQNEAQSDQQAHDEIEIILTRGEVQGKASAKRLFVVNGVRRQKRTATSFFSSVVFRPEDMRLIEGSPTRRRSFIDGPLSFVSKEYEQSLHTYEQTLLRRNKLLQKIRDGQQPLSTLEYWNLSLVKHGELIQKYRRDYLHSYSDAVFPVAFSVVYQPSVISSERLKEYQSREIAAGHTLIGPHKDDFVVEITKVTRLVSKKDELKTLNVGLYGSRGEQRLAVLWLKFGELHYLEKHTRQKPILLLDDILSELDSESQGIALSVVPHYQTIITTIDPELKKRIVKYAPDSQVVTLERM